MSETKRPTGNIVAALKSEIVPVEGKDGLVDARIGLKSEYGDYGIVRVEDKYLRDNVRNEDMNFVLLRDDWDYDVALLDNEGNVKENTSMKGEDISAAHTQYRIGERAKERAEHVTMLHIDDENIKPIKGQDGKSAVRFGIKSDYGKYAALGLEDRFLNTDKTNNKKYIALNDNTKYNIIISDDGKNFTHVTMTGEELAKANEDYLKEAHEKRVVALEDKFGDIEGFQNGNNGLEK